MDKEVMDFVEEAVYNVSSRHKKKEVKQFDNLLVTVYKVVDTVRVDFRWLPTPPNNGETIVNP